MNKYSTLTERYKANQNFVILNLFQNLKILCEPVSVGVAGRCNHYITRQLQSERCLCGKSFRSRNKCGMTFSEFASSGRVIVMISECSSGRELLWVLSCRYKKVPCTHNSFYVKLYQYRHNVLSCLRQLGKIKKGVLSDALITHYTSKPFLGSFNSSKSSLLSGFVSIKSFCTANSVILLFDNSNCLSFNSL